MVIQQFEIIRLICSYLDAHKNRLSQLSELLIPLLLWSLTRQKSLNTTNSDTAILCDCLLAQNCHNVCMESTSKYRIPIFNILELHMYAFLTHLKYVKYIKSRKTHKCNAKWITNLFRSDTVKSSTRYQKVAWTISLPSETFLYAYCWKELLLE